jgi:hypothetical protein
MIRQKMIFNEKPPRRLPERSSAASLRFSPTAWAKLIFLRDAGDSEVGGFGIAAADDPLFIEDVQLVGQVCDVASVIFDDASVADFFDRQADAGVVPARCGRIWIHTHPGTSPQPSSIDEETFIRAFGRTDWSVMFIVACGGKTYARMRFNVGPGGDVELPVHVDYSQPFAASDHEAWLAEYRGNVDVHEALPLPSMSKPSAADLWEDDWFVGWDQPFEQRDAISVEDHRDGI